MSPVIINLGSSDDQRDVVHRAVQALAEGQVVAFPTETVYGLAASALDEGAVERLLAIKGRQDGHPMTLAIKSAEAALDYVPQMSTVAWRVARRCWPGPVTLVLRHETPDSLVHQLPPKVRQAVAPGDTVGLRVPSHPVLLSVLRLMPGPLVLTSANRTGEPDATTAAAVAEELGEDVPMILDDGPCKFSQPSSVIRVDQNRVDVLRAGVVGATTIRRLTSFLALLVCTGNTCRSPMAEALMRDRLAKRLGCDAAELEERGVLIMSAGIAAMAGGRAAVEAAEAVKQRGLDLSHHESQPLTDGLVRYADLILTMTRGHRDAIITQWPDAAERTRQICQDGRDVSDPIGGPAELYERCAAQIDEQLATWVEQLDLAELLCVEQSG